MKLWVVYYTSCSQDHGHKYFQNEDAAIAYYNQNVAESVMWYWELDEIETED